MEDDVFGNNESDKQKEQGDKNEGPNSSLQPSPWRKEQEDAQEENAGVSAV